MKKLQKFQVTVKQQKIIEEKLTAEKTIADSVADELIQQGKEFDPKELSAGKIHHISIWKEAKKEAAKKEDKK